MATISPTSATDLLERTLFQKMLKFPERVILLLNSATLIPLPKRVTVLPKNAMILLKRATVG